MPKEDLKKPAAREKSIWVIAGEYSSLGMILPAAVFVGWLIGYFVDQWLGTAPYATVAFIVLGAISGFIQIFRFLKKHED